MSQVSAIVLWVASLVIAGGASLALGSLRSGRKDPPESVIPRDADGKPRLSESRRFPPLHY